MCIAGIRACLGPARHRRGRAGTPSLWPLPFNSVQYALVLPVAFTVYWLLPGRRPRQLWLLLASYVFYAWFDWRFLLLLVFTTAVDYSVGRALEVDRPDRRRKLLLAVSLTVNLVVLGFFKYAGFFVDQGAALMQRFGIATSAPTLRILLPYGISFYTFQSMAYAIDVYRRKMAPCRDLLDFATFVAFFPQLIAGPISRAWKLLPQIEADRPFPNRRRLGSALLLILSGLVKKVAIADPVSKVADAAFADARPGSSLALAGIVAFSIQIYADFSGYTDIARGTARLFNVDLVHNFTQPYLSRSLTEFWRRWHISLSTWLRDYLYVPLGGNRGGTARTYRNLMLTMLLGGLWHGAAWTFVIWGGLHGLYLVGERLLRVDHAGDDVPPALRDLPRILFTFALVAVAWVFFRAQGAEQAFRVLRGIADPGGTTVGGGQLLLVLVWAAAVVAIDIAGRKMPSPYRVARRRPYQAGVLVGLGVLAVVLFSGQPSVQFIYFQF